MFWWNYAKGALPTIPAYALRMAAKNSGCDVWFWSYKGNVTTAAVNGVTGRDATECLDVSSFKRALKDGIHVAHLADLVRYIVLHKYGGWWVDMDCVIIKKLPRSTYMFQSIVRKVTSLMASHPQFADLRIGLINIAVIKVPKGSELASKMVDFIKERIDNGRLLNAGRGSQKWNDVTRHQLKLIKEGHLEKHVEVPSTFYMLRDFPKDEASRLWFGTYLPGLQEMRKKTIAMDLAYVKFRWDADEVINRVRELLAKIKPAAILPK